MTLDDFSEHTIELEDDYEGKVVATLVESDFNKKGRPSVLYLHGYSDYFFHVHVAEQFHRHGYNFFALDLRKYGRSILPHQHPNYCRSITEYFEEIDKSLEIISSKYSNDIILLAHSMGGLVASVYLNIGTHKEKVSKLILNSPFLEFNINFWQRTFLLPLAGLIAFFFPYASREKPFSEFYGTSIAEQEKGSWTFNTDWKPIEGFPAYYKWIHAINRAQNKLRQDSDIHIPILILHSDASSRPKSWDEIVLKTDMVLNVDHIKRYGKKLGKDVTFAEINDAMHDVFLSQNSVRKSAYKVIFNWLH